MDMLHGKDFVVYGIVNSQLWIFLLFPIFPIPVYGSAC